MGQGDFVLEYPELHELAASKNPVLRWLHDFSIKLNPEPHRRVFLKPFMRDADAGVLLIVPQGASGRAGEQLSLVPRLQRVRQLAGQRRVRPGRALVLLSAEAAGLPGLPHAAYQVERHGQHRRHGPLAFFPGRQYRAAVSPIEDQQQMELEQNFLKSGVVTIDIFALSNGRGQGPAPRRRRRPSCRPPSPWAKKRR